jgi:hypothetical protein
MAQPKKKAPAGNSNNSTQPGTLPDGPPLNRQTEETNPQIEDVTTEDGLHEGLVEEAETTEALQTQSAELTEAALQLKALQKRKEIIEAQLATKKRALY